MQTSHPDLQGGRLLPGYDFVDNDATPEDGDGHGTHVLGIVGAAESNGVGVASVAPGARLMPVRVLGDDGSGFVSDVAKGIDYAVDHGAQVINLSLGSEIPLLGALGGDEYDDAIRRALAAGRVVVASSGNNGTVACEQPAADDGLLCVGAVNDSGMRTSFSSFGAGLGADGAGQQRALHLQGQRLHPDLGHVAGRPPRVGRGGPAGGEGPTRPGRGEPHSRHRARCGSVRPGLRCTERAS